MKADVSKAIDMKISKENRSVEFGSKEELNYLRITANPDWNKFRNYCRVMEIKDIKDIKFPPEWLSRMIKDKKWHPFLVKSLNNQRSV